MRQTPAGATQGRPDTAYFPNSRPTCASPKCIMCFTCVPTRNTCDDTEMLLNFPSSDAGCRMPDARPATDLATFIQRLAKSCVKYCATHAPNIRASNNICPSRYFSRIRAFPLYEFTNDYPAQSFQISDWSKGMRGQGPTFTLTRSKAVPKALHWLLH
jgi:hypothetical protein